MKSTSKIFFLSMICFFLTKTTFCQIAISPANAKPEDAITITFDAADGNKELVGANKVYMHHGCVTDKPDGTAWKYVKGNWGVDDGIGLMTRVPGSQDKWQITISPSVRAYFGVSPTEPIFRISCVFRSADGSKKGTLAPGQYVWGSVTSNQDIYINLKNDNTVQIISPSLSDLIVSPSDLISFAAEASNPVSDMRLWIDEGNGYEQKNQVSVGTSISYDYKPSQSGLVKARVTATMNGNVTAQSEREFSILIRKPGTILPLPASIKQGINYSTDSTKATLVLLAPGKQVVHVVGDMNNWQLRDNYQMNQTPDGKYFWLELENLIPNKSYVYQYWIDGKIKVGDPYADQVADPWNDKYIESSVYPNLPPYNRESFGVATVLRTGQQKFVWAPTEATYQRPDINHLTIYELHIRDFVSAHSFDAIRDTISYLKRLGIQAIELMPISEFEGNDSWGYNPSYYFAVDKYYGTKEALKNLIQEAHAQGMAVILDMVLNHSFSQSPLLQMYFDAAAGKPSADNPWYNREYVGQYQWGYDFNHESSYTKTLVNDINTYWLKEFHFDGFRFDFTKGLTNNAPGGSVDGFDQSRINILKQMNSAIKAVDPKAYVILEHWAPASEEQILAADGMKMWRNKTYDFGQAAIGSNNGSFDGVSATSHIPLYNSHDEQRIAYHCLTEGLSNGSYDIKSKSLTLERIKMTAAFNLLQPGPKMIWQFDELGYDIDINFNGRIGRKPYVWGPNSLKYYDDQERQNVYQAYKGIFDVREKIGAQALATATTKHKLTGSTRRLSYNTSGIDVVLIGNVDVKPNTMDVSWIQTGWWYDYFSGDSINVTSTIDPRSLKPGEWHIYTSKRLGNGIPNVVKIYDNPVTITPFPFQANQEITIRFDATKADPKNTSGLLNATEIYMHAGVRFITTNNSAPWDLTKTYPSHGKMSKVSDNLWEINIIPDSYFGATNEQEIRQLGMWFRDESNTKLGFGFRGSIIEYDVQSDKPIVTLTPASFTSDTEVTITFDAAQGKRELIGATKVYMHSGVSTFNTANPAASAWNKVKGNWAQDDGIGLMTKIPGTEQWQIKLKPKDYYGLMANEIPYWIAAVFRNSDGSKKGTGTAGDIDNGFIASNLDYFLKNQIVVGTNNSEPSSQLTLFPNPSMGTVTVNGLIGAGILLIHANDGQKVLEQSVIDNETLDLTSIKSGVYIYSIKHGNMLKKGKLIILNH